MIGDYNMIIFKKKSFAVPIAAAGGMAAMNVLSGLGLAQGVASMYQGKKLQDEQLQEQRRLQNQQLKAQQRQNQQMMNTLKQVAKQNPTVAGAAAGQQIGLMQQQFAIPAGVTNFLKNAKGVAKDALTVGKKMGAHKHLANTLAMGTTMAGAGYLVDKGIQLDAKRSGIDLGDSDDRKENGKKLGKAALATGATALTILGAKRGLLGKSIQGTANKYINRENAAKVAKTIKTGFKEQFYDPKKMAEAKNFKDKLGAINKTSIAITAAFPAMSAIGYATNKEAMKEQAKQSEEVRQKIYAAPAIGTLGQRFRVLGFKNVMKQGASNFQQGAKNVARDIKYGASSWSKNPVRNTLSGISRFLGGGGKKGTNRFINEMKQQASVSGNEGTAKVADFLGRHKTLAVGGSIAVGSTMLAPWGWGDKAVRTVTGAVDKNSMKFEKSQEKTVE